MATKVHDGKIVERAARSDIVRQARGAPRRTPAHAGSSRRRRFYFVLLAVVGVGVAAIGRAVQRGRAADAPIAVPETAAAPGAPRAVGYVLGRADAPVEIVEYADFECPLCAHFALTTERAVRRQLIATGRARYRFYDFQINTGHRNSPAASLAAACAADQGRFWPMHDRLFGRQREWNSHVTNDPRPVFARYAREDAGLDAAQWAACYDERRDVSRLAAHRQEATRAHVEATPSFVVGNRMLRGPRPIEAFTALIDSAASRPPADVGGPPTGALR